MKEIRGMFGWPNRRVAIAFMAIIALMALIGGLALPPFSGSLVLADHDSTYLVCPDPVSEGDSSRVGIRRSGYKMKRATFFTDHRYYTADSNDYEALHGLTVESDSSGGDRTLWAPIVTKEDTMPEHDETFSIGFWDDNVWHFCVVTIEDDDAPEIVNVEIASEPVDMYAYRAGESIDVAVDLDQEIDVDGTPLLSLFFGDGNRSTWRGAEYHQGSGTNSLIFRYVVKPEDMDPDGISVAIASVNDDRTPAQGFSGNIYAAGTDVPIDHTHSGVKGDWRQKVDGRPYVQSARILSSPTEGWEAYRANDTIELSMTFNTDVVVEGDVTVDLHLGLVNYNWDEAERKANYLRGSGTDTLVFGYTVQPGDMDSMGVGLTMGTEKSGFAGSGSIKAKGTDVDANPWYLGWGHDGDHLVDTDPPTVLSLAFISSPTNGEAYAAGELISIEATFDERVTTQGTPSLQIDVGTEVREATVRSIPQWTFSSSLIFDYTVQEGDSDTDGVGIAANRLMLNNGGIYDSAGISLGLSHDALGTDPTQKVDA